MAIMTDEPNDSENRCDHVPVRFAHRRIGGNFRPLAQPHRLRDTGTNLSNGICLSRRQSLGPYSHVLEGSHLHELSQRLVTTPGQVRSDRICTIFTQRENFDPLIL